MIARSFTCSQWTKTQQVELHDVIVNFNYHTLEFWSLYSARSGI